MKNDIYQQDSFSESVLSTAGLFRLMNRPLGAILLLFIFSVVPGLVFAETFSLNLEKEFSSRRAGSSPNLLRFGLKFKDSSIDNISCIQQGNRGFSHLDKIYIRTSTYTASQIDVLFASRFQILRVTNFKEKLRPAVALVRPKISEEAQDIYDFIVGYCDLVDKKERIKRDKDEEISYISNPNYNSLSAALALYCKNDTVCLKTLKTNTTSIGNAIIKNMVMQGKIHLDSKRNDIHTSYVVKAIVIANNTTEQRYVAQTTVIEDGTFQIDFKGKLNPGQYTVRLALVKEGEEITQQTQEYPLVIPEPFIELPPVIEFTALNYPVFSWTVKHYQPDMTISINGIDIEPASINEPDKGNSVSSRASFTYSLEGEQWQDNQIVLNVEHQGNHIEKVFGFTPPDNVLSPILLGNSLVFSAVFLIVMLVVLMLLFGIRKLNSIEEATLRTRNDIRATANVGLPKGILAELTKVIIKAIDQHLMPSHSAVPDKVLVGNQSKLPMNESHQQALPVEDDFQKIKILLSALHSDMFSKLTEHRHVLQKEIEVLARHITHQASPEKIVDGNVMGNSSGQTLILKEISQYLKKERGELATELAVVKSQLKISAEKMTKCNDELQHSKRELNQLESELTEREKKLYLVQKEFKEKEHQFADSIQAKTNQDNLTIQAFEQFVQQVQQDKSLDFPAIHMEHLSQIIEMLSSGNDETIFSNIRNESLYREAIAALCNIIYWYHWLSLHQGIFEQTEYLYQCLISSLALRGVYIENGMIENAEQNERIMATNADFNADIFYLSDSDTLQSAIQQSAISLFKLEMGFPKGRLKEELQLTALFELAQQASSRLDMHQICEQLNLESVIRLKTSIIGLSRQVNNQKDAIKSPRIKVF